MAKKPKNTDVQPDASLKPKKTREEVLRENAFKPGQIANPNGRPKGARNKLGEQFLQDLYADWQEGGAEAIIAVRLSKPDAYLKVIASILPKELNVNVSEFEGMTDEQLNRRIRELAADVLGISAGTGEAPGRAETAH